MMDAVADPDLITGLEGATEERHCHLLDKNQEALCYADISGRGIHNRNQAWLDTSAGDAAVCAGCGYPVCPRCEKIDVALARPGAA